MAQVNAKNGALTVGTTPTIVSEAKSSGYSERIRLILTNTSTGGETISIAVDADPVAGAGLVLSPGGSMAWEKQAGTPIQQLRVLALGSGAGATLAIYEEVLQ